VSVSDFSAAGKPFEAGHQFVVHWLDNKEIYTTLQAEMILKEMNRKASLVEHSAAEMDDNDGGGSDDDGGGTNAGSGVNTPGGTSLPRHMINGMTPNTSDPSLKDSSKLYLVNNISCTLLHNIFSKF